MWGSEGSGLVPGLIFMFLCIWFIGWLVGSGRHNFLESNHHTIKAFFQDWRKTSLVPPAASQVLQASTLSGAVPLHLIHSLQGIRSPLKVEAQDRSALMLQFDSCDPLRHFRTKFLPIQPIFHLLFPTSQSLLQLACPCVPHVLYSTLLPTGTVAF